MTTNRIEIQDDAGNIYHPHTEASVVFLKDGSSVEQNMILNAACSYASGAYTLSIPNAPAAYPAFFSVRFKAPNDYADGAKMKIGASAYTAKNAAFSSGDVVTADFDKAAVKCFFKSGGGGGVIGSMGVDIAVAASRPAAVTNNRIVVINGAPAPKIIVTMDIPAYSSELAQNTIFIRIGPQVADRPTINAGSKAGVLYLTLYEALKVSGSEIIPCDAFVGVNGVWKQFSSNVPPVPSAWVYETLVSGASQTYTAPTTGWRKFHVIGKGGDGGQGGHGRGETTKFAYGGGAGGSGGCGGYAKHQVFMAKGDTAVMTNDSAKIQILHPLTGDIIYANHGANGGSGLGGNSANSPAGGAGGAGGAAGGGSLENLKGNDGIAGGNGRGATAGGTSCPGARAPVNHPGPYTRDKVQNITLGAGGAGGMGMYGGKLGEYGTPGSPAGVVVEVSA